MRISTNNKTGLLNTEANNAKTNIEINKINNISTPSLENNNNEIEEYNSDSVEYIENVKNKYDENGKILVTHVYDNLGNYIISEELYNYDLNGNLLYKTLKDFMNEKITIIEYKDEEVTRISNYKFDVNSGQKTLIDTMDVASINELIKKKGNLTYKDIQKMMCFDNSNNIKLTTVITEVLTDEQIEEINNKIKNAVKYAGYGTGPGVAAAAITLITELQNHGIYLPYYYSGGHGSISIGISPLWGRTVGSTKASDSSPSRNIDGLDCSGFVMWAIKNGGIDIPEGHSAKTFTYLHNTSKVDFNELTTGDLLSNKDHVILVLDTFLNEQNETIAICAEATGDNETNGTSDGGVVITTYTESKASELNYRKVNMDYYYENMKKME